MKTIAFFNNNGGTARSALVYHLAYMLAEHNETVLAVDLDPQANLTSMFVPEDDLELLWPNGEHPKTIFGALRPIIRGIGDVETPHLHEINPRLALVVGDPALSTFEDKFSEAWHKCYMGDASAFRTITAFFRGVRRAATAFGATWVLIDVGPNLGAINRAALIASQHVVVPLGTDLFSLRGLQNLGPALRRWRGQWNEMSLKNPDPLLELPAGQFEPLGYVVMQYGMRENQLPKAYQRWIDRLPGAYRESVLDDHSAIAASDPYCLAILKHYRSLMPMAMEARKPVFSLKPADGAIGAHGEAVRNAYGDFLTLAKRIAKQSDAALS